MAENSKIEWTDHTFNPWIGCTEVSPACDNCYARVLSERWGWAQWGTAHKRHVTSDAKWREPLKWNRVAQSNGTRPRVFCASLSDWADQEIPIALFHRLEALIEETTSLDWLLLSKRHNAVARWSVHPVMPHVRLGFTVENEEWAKIRLKRLAVIAARGWKTFVSYEPALGPVDWDHYLDREGPFGNAVQWLICGGESAQGVHRPMREEWAYMALNAARRHGVPFFMKQIDKKTPIPEGLMVREFPEAM